MEEKKKIKFIFASDVHMKEGGIPQLLKDLERKIEPIIVEGDRFDTYINKEKTKDKTHKD